MNIHQNAPLWLKAAVIAVSIALVVITALLTGCGGGGSTASTGAQSIPAPVPAVVSATSSSSSSSSSSSGSSSGSSNSSSSSSSSSSSRAVNQSVGGLWNATVANGIAATMLTTETGDLFIIGDPVDTESVGSVQVSGDVLTGTSQSAVPTPNNCPWDAGAVSYDLVLAGTVSARTSLTLNLVVWTYDALYNQPSSLALIAGTWSGSGVFGPGDSATVDIGPNGVISAQDSTCTLSGQVSLIDPSFNAYAVTLSYSNCADDNDSWAVNGITGTGAAYIDNTVSPAVLNMMVLFPVGPSGSQMIGHYYLPQQ
jgi:hypothetical protein